MLDLINKNINIQKEMIKEVNKVFKELNFDVNNISYKNWNEFKKDYLVNDKLIRVNDISNGYIGITFEVTLFVIHSDKTDGYIECVIHVNDNKIYCAEIKSVGTCFYHKELRKL